MEIHLGPTRYLEEAGNCPVCHTKLDGYEYTSEKPLPENWTPKPGDYSVCLQCGSILCYEIGMQYRLATRDDLREAQERQPETFAILQNMVLMASRLVAQRRGEKRMKGRKKRWH